MGHIYYYVRNKAVINGNQLRFSLESDPLMSFKDEIRLCSGIVRKNANEYNVYLDDGSLKVYQNKLIITKEFPSGFPIENDRYILITAGG